MGLDLAGYDDLAREAVKTFWATRLAARDKQRQSGSLDQGERAGVTAGKNMDGFLGLVSAIVVANGLDAETIQLRKRVLTLPGFFRPTKLWDMLVIPEGRLIAALEFKSQVGPSFGNNFNNRTEEAIGTALDLAIAFREGAFGDQPRPFVGWLMLLEDAESSRRPITDRSPHFPTLAEFAGASYAQRYHLLCQKMMQEKLYEAAVLLLSSHTDADPGEYREFDRMTGLRTFVSLLAAHVASEAAG